MKINFDLFSKKFLVLLLNHIIDEFPIIRAQITNLLKELGKD